MRENNQRHNPFILAPALLLPILLFLGIAGFIISNPFEKNISYIIIAILLVIVYGVPTVIFFRLRGGKWISSCLAPLSVGSLIFSISAALMMMAHSTFFRSLTLGDFFDYRIYTIYGMPFRIDVDSVSSFVGAFLALALVPAVLEGIFFRGILMYEYRYGGIVLSVFMSSVLYAATSAEFISFPLYFLNGFMLSVIVFLTGNLFCSILAHIIYILFSMMGEKYLLFLAAETETRGIMLFLLLGVWLTVAIVFFESAEKLLRKRGENEQPKPIRLSRRNFLTVFYDILAVPMLGADAFCFFIFAILHLLL